MKLNLERPVVFFDLETTGTNILHDRIVEISVIKVFPDGTELRHYVWNSSSQFIIVKIRR